MITEKQLLEAARSIAGLREAAERDKAAHDKAYEDWKAANTLLIEAKEKSSDALKKAEDNLRQMMVDYHSETGATKYLEALEIRMTPKPEYDATFLKRWLMVEAPARLALSLVTLDTKAVEAWLKERADEQGAISPLEGAAPIPALVVKKPVAAILSKGLATLPEPPKMIVDTAPVLTIPADAVAAVLTQDAVLEAANFAASSVDEKPADESWREAIPF